MSQQEEFPADILDLSIGGAALLLQGWPVGLGAGTTLGLDVSSHPDFRQNTIQATLRWLEPVSSSFQPCWLVGVQFHEPLAGIPLLMSC